MNTPAPPTAPVVIAVANAKGGVGKTSIVANLAGITALAGWRVLVIDLDPQENLVTDLGITNLSDHGASLAVTLSRGEPPITLSSVRSRLNVWGVGPALATSSRSALTPEVDHPLQAAIGSIGGNYDFVYTDCPPALGPLVDAGLTAADLLLAPIRADHASLSGLHMIIARLTEVSAVNPGLELLGITFFDVSRSVTAIVRDVADAIAADFGDLDPRLLPAIRRSERSAFDIRRSGLLAYEYEQRQSGTSVTPLAERINAERSEQPVE